MEQEGKPLRGLVPGFSRPLTIRPQLAGLPLATAGLSLTLPLLAATAAAGVRLVEWQSAVDLLVGGGRVGGVLTLDRTGHLQRLQATSVVLASGGGGRLFASSNNTREMTGDGLALVFGRRAGRAAAGATGATPRQLRPALAPSMATGNGNDAEEIRRRLRALLQERAGVARSGPGLSLGLSELEVLCDQFASGRRDLASHLWWETRHMLATARLLLTAALRREESRGAHFREDFPMPDEERWRGSLLIRRDSDGEAAMTFQPAAEDD